MPDRGGVINTRNLLAFLVSLFLFVWVSGYYRSNGTYVDGYYRSRPNAYTYDNYSYTYPSYSNGYGYNDSYYYPSYNYSGSWYTPSYYDDDYDYGYYYNSWDD